MTDELTEVGGDGIRRSFDEHYDTVRDVEENPTGAMWAIHKQAVRIEELEAALAAACAASALSSIWSYLGVKDQTACMYALEELKKHKEIADE
jgi:hypothetical protein